MTLVHTPVETDALQSLSVLGLAHVGDAVFELLVRTHLARLGGQRVSDQHKRAISFVSAPAQAAAMNKLVPLLTEEEHKIYHRGRNARVHGCPSGCTVAEYHTATALEALFGWLWLCGRRERVQELFAFITEAADAS